MDNHASPGSRRLLYKSPRSPFSQRTPARQLSSPVSSDSSEYYEIESTYVIYKRRWYILAVGVGISSFQGGFWANWGPIADATKPLFHWDNGTIALLANWGPFMYFLTIIPTTWLMDVKGLRIPCVISSGFIFLGSLARVVPGCPLSWFSVKDGSSWATFYMHLGQALNGLAGPMAMSVGPALSQTWFPPSQRTTATAIISSSNYGGCAMMFVLGPLLVPTYTNSSSLSTLTQSSAGDTSKDLWWYMIYELAASTILFLCCICYFPDRPPTPPSRTAEHDASREDFGDGARILVKKKQFWVLFFSYGIVTGLFGGWGSMLGPNLQTVLPASDAQIDAGWIGFWSAIAGGVGGVGIGMYADRFSQGRMRILVIIACTIGAICFVVFALSCASILPVSIPILYASSIVGGFFINSCIPLFYEMAVEQAYPVKEGFTTGLLTVSNNIWAVIFLLLPMIPGIGTTWMNYSVAGAAIIGLISMIFYREYHHRLDIDGIYTGDDKILNSPQTAG